MTISRVSRVTRRSKRMTYPTSRPTSHPFSSAMRTAAARAATRRGWSRITFELSIDRSPGARKSAGGSRVVFPAPGSATSTSDRRSRNRAIASGRIGSIGSGTMIV